MVLTAAHLTSFFEDNAQMALPHPTRLCLQVEGITTVNNIRDFDKDMLKQVAETMRRLEGRVPDPDPGAVVGATIPTPPFAFCAKS